jgi:GT2 family glycosyltransferase
VPEAVVYHVGSASSGIASDFAVYHGHRNLVWTYFKNMPGLLFWLYLPLHLAVNFYLAFSYLFGERRLIVWRAKLDALRGLPAILRKRSAVQRARLASVSSLHSCMRRNWLEPRQASRLARQRASTIHGSARGSI